jgi:hypothetical protein
MHDNLVTYVNKLKAALLPHSLTPLENSLLHHNSIPTADSIVLEDTLCAPNNNGKRTLAAADSITNTQETDLEDEYNDIPDRKRFKSSTTASDSDDPDEQAMLDDLLSIPTRPLRSKTPTNYTIDSSDEEDEDEEITAPEPPVLSMVGSPRTPEETVSMFYTEKSILFCSY